MRPPARTPERAAGCELGTGDIQIYTNGTANSDGRHAARSGPDGHRPNGRQSRSDSNDQIPSMISGYLRHCRWFLVDYSVLRLARSRQPRPRGQSGVVQVPPTAAADYGDAAGNR